MENNMRFFNTAGPVKCKEHYCISPLKRFNMQNIFDLIDQEKYFVLHAPRQTGKTSCLFALMDYLNANGKYKALYFNVEAAQGARENVQRAIKAILDELADRAEHHIKDFILTELKNKILKQGIEDTALNKILTEWCRESDLPIVLFIDEIDSLIGDTLISVLRQIRSGYDKRPAMFPQSIVLCGVRDVRDYRLHSAKEKAVITGGSAFNIKAESLRLGDFSKQEISFLYGLHTKETGQEFTPEAIDMAAELTKGQPWIVNALAYEACFKISKKDSSITINAEIIEQAKNNIILRRETHLDQLMDKLKEERVKRVIEPILAGKEIPLNSDDVEYVFDLGMIKQARNGKITISNKIYQEVIPRELGWPFQSGMAQESAWYINENGELNMKKLMKAFQNFFRNNSDSWLEGFLYKEAGPQVLLQAFLQRIINSGGEIHRKYAIGKKRTDLLIIWKNKDEIQKIVIELKIKYGKVESDIKKGLEQTSEYMDICGSSLGHLVIFDRDQNKKWEEKIFYKLEKYKNFKIHVWGM
jgi:hypothetical protein